MASIATDKSKLKPKKELITILDDLDFSWTHEEINKARFMWTAGWSLKEIAKALRPKDDNISNAIDEVFLLMMHLSRQGKIKPREGGIYGQTR